VTQFIRPADVTADFDTVIGYIHAHPYVKALNSRTIVTLINRRWGAHLRAVYAQMNQCFALIRDRPDTNRGNRYVWDVSSVHVVAPIGP